MKIPFYKKTWFIILILLILPPAGIALMWIYKKNWLKQIKIAVSIIAGIYFILAFFVNPTESTVPEDRQAVSITVADVATEQSATAVQPQTAKETTAKPTTTKTTTTKPTTAKPTTTKTTTTKPTTAKPTTTKTTTTKPTTAKPTTTKPSEIENPDSRITVYRTPSGNCYHYENPCGNGTYYPITLAEAKTSNLKPCGKCVMH